MNGPITRLKNSIDHTLFERFDKSLMGKYHFVVIAIKNNFLFVAISKNANKDEVSKVLKQSFNNTINFMLVGDDDVKELLQAVLPSESIADLPKGGDTSELEQDESQVNKSNARLGEMLVAKGLVSQVDLVNALAESKRKGVPIGSTLFERGTISLDQLKSVLHEQSGLDLVTADQLVDQKKYIDKLPEDVIRANSVIPVYSDGKVLVVGVLKPLERDLVKQLMYMSGSNIKQLLMTHYEFQKAMDNFFSEQKKATEQIIKEIESEQPEDGEGDSLAQILDNEMKELTGSVAKLVNQIITNGIDGRVSDIHIEPRLSGYIVRYRKDGMLQKVMDIPAQAETAVIARFKVMARMNIAENRRPQDGTFSIEYRNCSYDFRINTLPVSGKEKVCIRILAPAVSLASNDKEIKLVGAADSEIQKIKQMVSCPNGIILTSGPTGSGKTTTLYSVLKSLNDESVNITTIEDPIEIKLEGINQSQINAKAGITFASCMRAILRQDPDIILVGEIRDYETLEIAISAALTGHLVLSTVHTNSAAATVTRMIEMGAKDYLVSSTLSGVIAQRLVRRLCDKCKEEYYPTKEEAMLITRDPQKIEELMKTPLYRAKGCNDCGFQGYKGRLGVYEIMLISKEIKKLIAQGAHDLEIEECAVKDGMKTLHTCCYEHILKGWTTIEEFVRVLGMAGE